jgi:arylsulfatase A-like enzyme
MTPDPPINLLLLHSHDTGRCLQPYGYDVQTPAIQALAGESAVFRQAFCLAPSCSPSRASMLTGQYPHVCGMFGLANPPDGFALHNDEHHLSRFLRDQHGYQTVLCGVQHEARPPKASLEDLGYQQLHGIEEADLRRHDPHLPAAAFLDGRPEGPWFMSVGFTETHRDNPEGGVRHTYDAGTPSFDQLDGRWRRPPGWLPDTPETRQDWASFGYGAKRLDEKVDHVLQALQRSGQAERTLVILTTDHGIAWPHGKGNLTDAGLGVALMMRGPGGPEGSVLGGGRVFDAMVTHLDVYPTVCEVLGLEPPGWLQGRSLLPLVRGVRGEVDRLHEAVFAEQNAHAGFFDPQRSVRTDRHKYIRRGGDRHIRIVDPGPTNQLMRDAGFVQQPAGRELLYDLLLDPNEVRPVTDDPAYGEVLDEMRGRLGRWMQRTDDPFREGRVPRPMEER